MRIRFCKCFPHFIAYLKGEKKRTPLQKSRETRPSSVSTMALGSLLNAAAVARRHCLRFACGKLIAMSIMKLNEFVYPAQFTRLMGEVVQPSSSKQNIRTE